MLVDTHCHLNFDAFDADRTAVIERARAAGVMRILNPGVDLPSSRAALALAEASPEIFAAVGVHPNDGLSWNDDSAAELLALARSPRVKAIGEIGLDYYRQHCPRPIQVQVFTRQLELAAQLTLPVVLHVRNENGSHKATEDLLDILQDWTQSLQTTAPALVERPGVLHSYSDNFHYAERAFVINFDIGITGPVTYRNAEELRAVVRAAPFERLLVETDAPFLAPYPHRGERNEPLYVREISGKIAQERALSLELVTQQIFTNAERLFHW